MADQETEARRGQQLAQQGAGLGFWPSGQAPGPGLYADPQGHVGGNISLPRGSLPPPSLSLTLCPVIPGALNVQVMKHTLQRAGRGAGGAGRCWRSCFIAPGALQPPRGWSRKRSAPRGICPQTALVTQRQRVSPTFPVRPLPPGQAQPWGPWLISPGLGSGQLSSQPCTGVRQPPRPPGLSPLLPLFGRSHLVSSVPASSGSPCPGLSPPRLPELDLTASFQRAGL